jgi:uncharacterized membrane protein
MPNAWTRLKQHIRRRFLIGVVVFAPFGLTIWVLIKLIAWGKDALTKPIVGLLKLVLQQRWPDLFNELYKAQTGQFVLWVDLSALLISILLVLFFLYVIGVLSATFFGRRYIGLGEKLLRHLPGAQFVYSTAKQLIGILSKPKSNAFKQVVLVEYPRTGVWTPAFFTGVTRQVDTGKLSVNVFVPCVPNPMSGFLLMMKPEEVRLTSLTVAEASRFLFSVGVVALEKIESRPFPIEAYLDPRSDETGSIGRRAVFPLPGGAAKAERTDTGVDCPGGEQG